MVERYRPGSDPAPRSTRYVGTASIKPATIKRAEKAGEQFRKKLGAANSTLDAFQNFGLNIGLGTNNALSQSQYGFLPITRIRTLLEWIHRGSWIGGMFDIIAQDMTRGGIELLTIEDPKQVEKIEQGMTRLKVWNRIGSTIKWANLYGGALGVLMLDGQRPDTPLRIDTVAKGQFKGLLVLDRWMVEPDLNHLVDEMGPHTGLPQWYKVLTDAPAFRGQKIHYTRCVRLTGVELPYWQSIMENLWGLSVFERIYDRMIAFDSATMGAAQLAYKSYVRTYKMDGLHEAVTTAGDAVQGINQRVEFMRKWQGIEGVSLIDSKDDFVPHQTTAFTGMADLLVHFAEQLSGALQIPLVRLLGQSPAGLNSTGESDLRTYYDNILQRQEDELREGVHTILRVIAMSLGIKLDDQFNFNFNPLWQLDEDQKSQVADRDTKSIVEVEAAGLISPQTALKELRQGSKATGRWTNITNEMIDEASDEVAPPEAETGGPGLEGAALTAGEGGPGEGPGEGGGEEGGEKAPPRPGGPQGEASPAEARGKPPEKGAPAGGALERLQGLSKVRRALGGGGNDRASRFGTRALDTFALPFTEVAGYQIVIEFYPGTIRKGPGWSAIMPCSYGYVRRVGSAEGPEEWLDALVGSKTSSRDVWVIDAITPEGRFDEHKTCWAFDSSRRAVEAFRGMYGDSRGIGAITEMSVDSLDFKNWMAAGDKTVPLAYDQSKRTLRAVA